MHRGVDKILRVTVYRDEARTQIKPLNGATVTYRIGNIERGGVLLERLGTVTDGDNGVCQFVLVPSDTVALKAKRHEHQVEVIDSGGKKDIVTDGYMTLEETIG